MLDSEEAAIKELEKQYKRALKDIEDKIKLFDYDIRQLEDAINADGLDDAAREALKSQQRAKVYQKQYQQALKGQISGIVDNLHAQQYATIDKYLKECYTDSFVGTMYSIAKQGVPLIMPIDQAAVVKAVLTDSKIVEGYYNHLGVNYAKLKKVITQEASRGIASGLSYAEMARNINNASKSGLYNAKRIARTEGHRIQQTSADDARQGAIKRGADLLKQWDAALDKRTRPSHARVDGEIREEGEKFSNGLLYPGDPNGSAEEVINCRCVALSRARWALDESELETLKERAEYFGLDKTKNYEDYKKKYLEISPKADIMKPFRVGKSVGAAAKNYPVKMPESKQHVKLAEGQQIVGKVFAGKGTNTVIRDRFRLESDYKIPADEWQKVSGKGFVVIKGTNKKAELHWYEARGERVELKVKRFLDES